MRQLELALHMHHDTIGSFPPGLSLLTDGGRYPYLGWAPRLLGFIDQEPLRQRIEEVYRSDPNPWEFYGNPEHVRLMGAHLPILACPSDWRAQSPSTSRPGLAAFSSYLGVSGIDLSTQDGVHNLDSNTRLIDITDGASNTLMLGERPPSADQVFGWWYRSWGQMMTGSADTILGVCEKNILGSRYECSPGPYSFGPGRFSNQCDKFHYWSPHPGGAGFALADGSVRFLTNGASDVLPALATRVGGEADQAP
jgi:prepilin-type processing-associated H-X9-DG protein